MKVLIVGQAPSRKSDGRLPFIGVEEAHEVHGVQAIIIPHPSGVSRYWNSKKSEQTVSCHVLKFLTHEIKKSHVIKQRGKHEEGTI